MIMDGSFYKQSFLKRFGMINKIKRLYGKVLGPISPEALRHIVTYATVFSIAIACIPETVEPGSNGPTFTGPLINPFNITNVGSTAGPQFVDIDNDGDQDLFVSVMDTTNDGTYYFQNIGTATDPSFASAVLNPFNLPYSSGTYNLDTPLISLADLDNDGDFDAIASDNVGDIYFLDNTGDVNTPDFLGPQSMPDLDLGTTYAVLPKLADVDNDGDFDLLLSTMVPTGVPDTGGYGYITIFENTSDTVPEFDNGNVAPINFSHCGIAIADGADLDGDGDMDIILGQADSVNYTSAGNLRYYENLGTDLSSDFSTFETNTRGLTPIDTNPAPALVDLDNDGDYDLLVGNSDGDFYYFENIEK